MTKNPLSCRILSIEVVDSSTYDVESDSWSEILERPWKEWEQIIESPCALTRYTWMPSSEPHLSSLVKPNKHNNKSCTIKVKKADHGRR